MRSIIVPPHVDLRRDRGAHGLTATLLVALLLAPLAVVTAQEEDPFFDAELDGAWVGTITQGKAATPIQLIINVDGNNGSGFVLMPDDDGVNVFAGDFTKTGDTKVTFRIDDEVPIEGDGRFDTARLATVTFKLNYKSGDDTVTGKASGGVKGKVALTRTSPDRPMHRYWSGSFKIGGSTIPVHMAVTEDADGVLGGTASFEGESATITGQRNGTKVTLMANLGGQEITFDGKLKAKNSTLQGKFSSEGDTSGNTKLVAGAGNGKSFKFSKVSRQATDVPAGGSATLSLTGKHLAAGATGYTNNPDVEVTDVQFVGSKEVQVTVAPSDSVADGTQVSLRLINGDGAVADRNNAFTVTGDGGGGGGGISFAAQVQPLFDLNCATAGCHAASTGAGGLVLDAGSSFANLVGVASSQQPGLQRVQAGSPDDSYLIRKLEGGPAITGGRMPLNRTPLTQGQINTIRQWISEGAANNDASPQ